MSTPNPARVREITTAFIMDRINDYDFFALGEYILTEEDLKDLSEEEFDAFKTAVDEMIRDAKIRITFPEPPAEESGRKLKGWLS